MNPFSIFSQGERLERHHFLASLYSATDFNRQLMTVRRDNNVNRAPNHLCCRIPVNSLGTRIPCENGPVERHADDCILGCFNYGRRQSKIFLSFSSLRYVQESHDQADPLAVSAHRVRPVLGGKTRAVLLPEDLIIHMRALAFAKRHVGSALASQVWRSVGPGMVD